jgi:hypothetical protein
VDLKERKAENGKRKAENGKRKTESGKQVQEHEVLLKLRVSEQKSNLFKLLQRAKAGSRARSAIKAASKRAKVKLV